MSTAPARGGELMPNQANTVASGRADGGYRSALYRDARGRYWKCDVLSGPSAGPFTIRIGARVAAGLAASQHTLTGIALASSKASTNAVHPSVRLS
jgi:hypothetical protein